MGVQERNCFVNKHIAYSCDVKHRRLHPASPPGQSSQCFQGECVASTFMLPEASNCPDVNLQWISLCRNVTGAKTAPSALLSPIPPVWRSCRSSWPAQTGCGRGDPGIRSMTSPAPRELWQFLADWMGASSELRGTRRLRSVAAPATGAWRSSITTALRCITWLPCRISGRCRSHRGTRLRGCHRQPGRGDVYF